MKIDLDDLRRQYSNLNDDALLAIDRGELTPVAQQVYDAEVASRGLASGTQEEEESDEPAAAGRVPDNWTEIATFENPTEAGVARSLLRQAEIPCILSTDLPMAGSIFATLSEIGLYVPADYHDQANEILDSEISDEELAAQAEAAGLGEDEETEEHSEEQAERKE